MKIERVHVKEFKCLKDIDTITNGGNILLVGDNAVGKSSFMQFIQIALGNSSLIPPEATGEGYVIFDKEGRKLTVTVRFKDNKPITEVITENGVKDKRKSVLAQLTGAIDFDIDEFVELSKSDAGRKKQVEIFKHFLPDETQFAINALERDIEAKFDERTEVNRKVKYAEGALESLRCDGVEEPVENLQTLHVKLSEAHAHNANIKSEQDTLGKYRTLYIDLSEKEKKLQAELDSIRAKIQQTKDAAESTKEFLSKHESIDCEILLTEIKEHDAKRQAFTKYQNYLAKAKELDDVKITSDALTQEIESNRTKLIETVKAAKTPVKGLSFIDGNLLYNDVPVDSNSLATSEIMHLGFQLKMAENPELGILFVKRAESLGKDKFHALLQMAKEHNLQLVIEQVERGTEQLKIEIFS